MSSNPKFVTIVRPGKQAKTVILDSGDTTLDLFVKAGFSADDYNGWQITDEDGDRVSLDDKHDRSTTLICGGRVDGATA